RCVLQRLRRRALESRVSGSRRAQSRVDTAQRRARCSAGGATFRCRGRCRLSCLPHADELHRALSQAPITDKEHRRPETSGTRGRSQRPLVSVGHASSAPALRVRTQVLLWAAQRISALVLAVCVVVHLVTTIYAIRNGLSAAEILS